MSFKRCYHLLRRNLKPILEFRLGNIPKLAGFYSTFLKYRTLAHQEKVNLIDLYPCIFDNTSKTPFDAHYFYQAAWAFGKIHENGQGEHVDVGSELGFIGVLSNITNVTFIDIRPFDTDLRNLTVKGGDILHMPFEDGSIQSLSCLHVAEHIGLGRYGDKLNAEGTREASEELTRVLTDGGDLYFSVPVGREKTHFNAHRVHRVETILGYFKGLELMELSGVTDRGSYIENIDSHILDESEYACGLFWFKK